MIGFVEAPRAFDAARRMAGQSGVDLTSVVLDGVLTRGEVEELVTRCASCGQTTECAGWHGPVPNFCGNHDVLAALSLD